MYYVKNECPRCFTGPIGFVTLTRSPLTLGFCCQECDTVAYSYSDLENNVNLDFPNPEGFLLTNENKLVKLKDCGWSTLEEIEEAGLKKLVAGEQRRRS